MYIFGYPLQAGEYPMTLRMTFANAGTKVIRFTVKYVEKNSPSQPDFIPTLKTELDFSKRLRGWLLLLMFPILV